MYGEKIKSKRKENKLSQEELANKLGITRQAISKWETEKATPTMTNLRELSEVFGVEMAYFIGDNKEEIEEKDKKEENIRKVNKKKISQIPPIIFDKTIVVSRVTETVKVTPILTLSSMDILTIFTITRITPTIKPILNSLNIT